MASTRAFSDVEIVFDCATAVTPNVLATTALLRVAQEALGNATRHARASRIDVTAEGTARQVKLSVRDDGVGFRVSPGL